MPESPIRSTARRDLLLAIPFAFALRLGYLIISRRAIDMADAIHYINMARGFVEGDFVGFDDNLPVLYSLFGALSYLATQDWEWAFWVVSLISSTMLVIPVYLIAEELHGPKSARISALFVCTWPWLVDYASRIAPEALAVTLWFSSVWLLYRGIRGSKIHLALAPLAFFALHLSRPEGTFLMLSSPLGAVILCHREDRAYWIRLFYYTVAVALLTLAYAMTMKSILGSITVSYRAPMWENLGDYIRHGSISWLKTLLELSFNVIPIMLGPFLLMFFGVGFFRYSDNSRKPRLELLILFFCFVQWSLAVANFSPAPRYLMTIIIAISLWSAKGIELLQGRAFYWERYRWVRFVPLLLVVLAFGTGLGEPIARHYWGSMSATPVEYKVVGQWMEEHLEPGIIFCRKSQVGFYAGMPTFGPDVSHTPEQLAELAKDQGVRYFVYDKRYSADMLPALRIMLDTSVEHENYRLLHGELSSNPNTQVVIYEFVTPGIEYISESDFPKSASNLFPFKKRRVVSNPL